MSQVVERTCGVQDGEDQRRMLTVHGVARMLRCSTRTVYRLADSGGMPSPVKLGAMVRWPRETVESWIAQGCPKASGMEARS